MDLRGLICPLPVLKTAKAMKPMAAGARVLVEVTDPMARIDIPHFCAEHGHRLVATETVSADGGEILRFTIEKAS
ncbi:sulfurtransferase TusA family protein [Breoghania sp. L-A4]|uniref:sulfurtransferase TusA family protein n=1 Tax=Breoghania sp. L-A4 TaxID=2304600 RepID=UPI000E35A1AE|nr:sulfurtransferase TusA family protein [Breoghania sp. L-A4]AXS38870.1 sulfurtransferase TusA family protein [Breoghania sp. L-A4]